MVAEIQNLCYTKKSSNLLMTPPLALGFAEMENPAVTKYRRFCHQIVFLAKVINLVGGRQCHISFWQVT